VAVALVEEEPWVVVAEEIAALPKARTARLAALVAAVVVVVAGPCPMWDVVRASTSKRPRTSMLAVVAISMQSAPEETSHASLQRVAC